MTDTNTYYIIYILCTVYTIHYTTLYIDDVDLSYSQTEALSQSHLHSYMNGNGNGGVDNDQQQLLYTPYTTHTLTSLEAMSSHNNNSGGGENGLLADKKKKSRAHLNNKDEQKGQNYDQYTTNNKLKRRNSDNEVDITLLNYAQSLTSAAAGKGKGQNYDPSLHGSLEKKPRKYNKTGKYTSHIDDSNNTSNSNNNTNNKYSSSYASASSQVNSSDKRGKKLTKAALEKKVNNYHTFTILLLLIHIYTLIYIPHNYDPYLYIPIIILTFISYHNYDLFLETSC